MFCFYDFPLPQHLQQYLEHEVQYFHCADEREASKKPHGSSYISQLVKQLGCSVLK